MSGKGTSYILLHAAKYIDPKLEITISEDYWGSKFIIHHDSFYRFKPDQKVWMVGKESAEPIQVFIYPAQVLDVDDERVTIQCYGRRLDFKVDSTYILDNKIEAVKRAALEVTELRQTGYMAKFIGTKEP